MVTVIQDYSDTVSPYQIQPSHQVTIKKQLKANIIKLFSSTNHTTHRLTS